MTPGTLHHHATVGITCTWICAAPHCTVRHTDPSPTWYIPGTTHTLALPPGWTLTGEGEPLCPRHVVRIEDRA